MKLVRVIVLLPALLGATAVAAKEPFKERRYYVSEERSYSGSGNGGVQAVVRRTTGVEADGSRVNRFYSAGAIGYDEIVGAVALPRKPRLMATFRTSPDRAELAGAAGPIAPVNAAAAAGSAARAGGGCSAWTGTAELPVPPAAGIASAAATITITPLGRNCLIEWRIDRLPIAGVDGTRRYVDFRGAALADADYELVASHSGYFAQGSAGGPLSGHRGIFLIAPGREWQDAAPRLALPGFAPRRPGGARPDLTLANAQEAFESARFSSMTGTFEAVALAYAERKANPLPLILGTLYVVDTVTTVLVNAAGAGVLAVGLGTDSATAQAVGGRMMNYPGVIGGAVQWTATQIGGQTAGEVAGLAYSAVTVFSSPAAINRAFATAALEHVLVRGGTATGQVGNLMIELGVQSQTVRPWLSQAQLGAQVLDQVVEWIDRARGDANGAALDMAGQQGSLRVSPTPAARGPMSLAADDSLRRIADPRSPFNQSTAGDFSESTAGLSDVIITGLLSFRLFDHAVEDGDIVALNVTGGGGTALAATVRLTNGGQVFNTGIGSGQAVIGITAQNLGDLPPNTGAISVVNPVVSGNATQTYNLEVGQTGLMRVLVLGRRARGN